MPQSQILACVLVVTGNTLKTAGIALAAASLTELLVTDNNSPPLNIVSAPALAKSTGIEVKLLRNLNC
jgi:hypothetical protein